MVALEASTSTPSRMTTLRTIFSPKKFLLRQSQRSSNSRITISSIPDLNLVQSVVVVLVNVDVDGEMGVDVTHLVLVALGDADDHVVDKGADSAESSDILAVAVVELDVDDVLFRVGE